MSNQTDSADTKESATSETEESKDVTRTRVRTRERRVTRTARTEDTPDDQAAAVSPEQRAGETEVSDQPSGPGTIRRRRRRRTTTERDGETATDADTPDSGDTKGRDTENGKDNKGAKQAKQNKEAKGAGTEAPADREKSTSKASHKPPKKSSSSKSGQKPSNDQQGAKAPKPKDPSDDPAQDPSGEEPSGQEPSGQEPSDKDKQEDADPHEPTRVQASSRGRGRSGKNGRGKGRRPTSTMSDATRRAINEGPPRRMMVTVGDERTQIAVLEQRSLMEHYVTRKADVSYVGNIYLGRVQNVLPGMEAAFIDIGKGRNGVLYAGEVNYDEADLDSEIPRIEEQLKPGQTVLVQVTKDPMGTKGARLTQHLSIAGRFCVLAPGDGMLGISRKLPDDERERLRKVLKDVKPDDYGLIVRTAAEDAEAEQLKTDVDRLVRKWETISKRAEQAKPLEAVYTEPNLVIRVIRDIFGPEYSELVVDNDELAKEIGEYLGDVAPDMVSKVHVHDSDEKLFDSYEISTQIRRALEKKVWLKSGGYLIIEKTEAMWVIDVNTGKFVGKDNLEETVLRNNLEAAEEIAHQLRLRDMGGIIVIDFVDMMVSSNRDEVLKRFKRELARDKTKSRVMDISKLGLVQMTRKNVSHGLTETFTSTCEVCEGRGATIAEDFS